MARSVTKIFGPPGTGKTTRLLTEVEKALASGIRPERIAYVAFTRKAAKEAISRAMQRFNLTLDRLPYFRTLHSLAFKTLGISREEMMQPIHYSELGARMGFQFSSDMDPGLGIPAGTLLGDKVSRIQSLARLRNVSLERQWQDSNEPDCPWVAVKQWDAGLAEYKRLRGFFDFTDLLEQCASSIDVDLFIVDEAQDLSPLQWHVARTVSARASRVILAGDDDQSIYGWAGADVSRFLRIKGDIIILPKSYRIPRKVQAIAQSVIERVQARQPKEWQPRDEEGEVEDVRYESSLDLGNGKSWLLLARNTRALKRFESVAVGSGYPYRLDGHHSTDDQTTEAIRGWERGRKGTPITPDEVRSVFRFLGRDAPKGLREEVPLAAVLPGEDALLSKTWMDALVEIPDSKREYIRACLANKEDLWAEPRIQISTIHRAKGGEADCVAIIPDLSAKPYEALNTDEEQRVLYVALTRAKQKLSIIQPQSMRFYPI